MKRACLAGIAAGALVLATACTAAAQASVCPAPRFGIEELKVGDGALDRGWIGGVSLADVDGDGDLDLYATHGYDTSDPNATRAPPPDRSMLYLNDGRGRFSRAADNALSNAENYASGSTFADVDADGDLDVFLGTQLGQKDAFYRNLGGGRFERQELGEATTTRGAAFTSTWVDMDADGDLDLHVGGPTLSMPEPTLIYRNDGGTFSRVTGLALDMGKSNAGAMLWSDLDGDGDQDVVIAASDIARRSDIAPAEREFPMVFRNDGAWRFTPLSGQAFDAFAALSGALGDIDADGDLDLFLGGWGPDTETTHDRLFRNDGAGRFSGVTAFSPGGHSDLPGGGTFADVDMDGDLDLVSAAYDRGIEVQLNDGAGNFTLLADPTLTGRVATHAATVSGDIDGDGDPDVVIGNWGEAAGGAFALVLRNESAPCSDWAEFVVQDRAGAPNPPGARVTLVTRGRAGERRHLREASAQSTFRGQSASAFLFALPKGERVLRVEVRWPDGQTRVLRDVRRNAKTVVRAAG